MYPLFPALLSSAILYTADKLNFYKTKNGIICLEPLTNVYIAKRCFSESHWLVSTQAPHDSPAPCFCLTPKSSPTGTLNSRSFEPLIISCIGQALLMGILAFPVLSRLWNAGMLVPSPFGESLLTLKDSAPRTPSLSTRPWHNEGANLLCPLTSST